MVHQAGFLCGAILIIFELISTSEADLSANVRQPRVIVTLGQPANVTCESPDPISSCLWEKVDMRSPQTLINFNPINAHPNVRGDLYSYSGDGLDKGHCGLQFERVRESDLAAWKCTIFSKSYKIYRGVVDVTNSSDMQKELERLTILQEQDRKLQNEIQKLKQQLLGSVRGGVRSGTYGQVVTSPHVHQENPSRNQGHAQPLPPPPPPPPPSHSHPSPPIQVAEEVKLESPQLQIKRKIQILQK